MRREHGLCSASEKEGAGMTKDQLIEWLNSMAGVCHGEGAWRDSDDDTLNELVARITPDPNSVPSAAEKPSDHADEGSRSAAGGPGPVTKEQAIIKAATELVALWDEMKASSRKLGGYWDQSLDERKEALQAAVHRANEPDKQP
jgi:hypothetical protein